MYLTEHTAIKEIPRQKSSHKSASVKSSSISVKYIGPDTKKLKKIDSEAQSHVIAVLLTVAIVVILAMIVFLWAMSMEMPTVNFPGKTPTIFEIRQLKSTAPNYEGHITLYNAGKTDYPNSDLYAEIYCNDVLLPCSIETFRGTDFISTHHYYVKTMSGSGCRNEYWRKGEKIAIDITDGLIKPGDLVRVDIFQKSDNSRISTDRNVVP